MDTTTIENGAVKMSVSLTPFHAIQLDSLVALLQRDRGTSCTITRSEALRWAIELAYESHERILARRNRRKKASAQSTLHLQRTRPRTYS